MEGGEGNLLSKEEIKILCERLQELNEKGSPALENIVKNINDASGILQKYRCKYCEYISVDKKTLDEHILQDHDEAIQCFLLNTKMFLISCRNLQKYIPDLQMYTPKIESGSQKIIDITGSHMNIRTFYFDCRLALEHIVVSLLKHFGVYEMDPTARLEEMLVKLKSMIDPPSRLNSFFQMKTIVGSAIHEIATSLNTGDLRTSDQMMMHFRNIIDESVLLFSEERKTPTPPAPAPIPISAPVRTPTPDSGEERINPPGDLYKTQLCANFSRGKCFLGRKCQFAHGSAELRQARCKFFIQGNCRNSECKYLHI